MGSSNQFKTTYLGILAAVSVLLSVAHVLTDGKNVPEFLIPTLCCAAIAAFGAAAFFCRKRLSPKPTDASLSLTFSASAIGFLFLTLLITSLFFGNFRTELFYYAEDTNAVVSAFVKLFAAISAIYFLLSASWLNFREHGGLRLALSFAPVLFFALKTLNEFINNSTHPLTESRGYLIFSLLFMMLFFMTESKVLAQSGNIFLLLLFGAGAVITGTIYNIFNLVKYLGGEVSTVNAICSILLIAVALHIIIRIANLPSPESEKEEPLPVESEPIEKAKFCSPVADAEPEPQAEERQSDSAE